MTTDKRTLVSQLIAAQIEKLAPRKNQRQLAEEMRFARPNFLSMLKSGEARVPFGKIPVIADVLEIDPALLLRLHLMETWPEFESVVFEIFGGVLTQAERQWIEFFSELGVTEPPTEPVQRKRLEDMILGMEWRD